MLEINSEEIKKDEILAEDRHDVLREKIRQMQDEIISRISLDGKREGGIRENALLSFNPDSLSSRDLEIYEKFAEGGLDESDKFRILSEYQRNVFAELAASAQNEEVMEPEKNPSFAFINWLAVEWAKKGLENGAGEEYTDENMDIDK
jgi:hypothetical protein